MDDFLEKLKSEHTKEAIYARLKKGPEYSYLKDLIFGAIDGTVTTFALVAGISGAQLAPAIIIILGFSNLIGNGFSMGVSNFLGTRAEQELHKQEKKEEEKHIALVPEGEKEEVRQIFASKGFQGKELEDIVTLITSNYDLWINTMLQEELGIPLKNPSPMRAGITTFISFIFFGLLPLLSFITKLFFPKMEFNPFILSIAISAITFFIIGAFKAQFTKKKWYAAAFQTVFLGGCASGLAYLIAMLLKDISAI